MTDLEKAEARIEELLKERDATEHRILDIVASLQVEADAKLFEAVEIGNEMAKSIAGNYYLPGIAGAWFAMVAKLGGKYD